MLCIPNSIHFYVRVLNIFYYFEGCVSNTPLVHAYVAKMIDTLVE